MATPNLNLSRRQLVLGGLGTAATAAFGKTTQAQEAVSHVSDLDPLFKDAEKPYGESRADLEAASAVRKAAGQKMSATINDPKFLEGLEYAETPEGIDYPVLRQKDVEHIAKALKTFLKEGRDIDTDFKEAVSFSAQNTDPKSQFRAKTFFVAKDPFTDAGKSTSVNFAKTFADQVQKVIPKVAKEKVDELYKFFRDHIYRNQFRYGDMKKPSGWHVFSQNGFRVEYAPKTKSFDVKYNYNINLTDDANKPESENKIFSFGFGHNNIVFHQNALIDASPNAEFQQYMSKDPQAPKEGEKHLETTINEVLPKSWVETFDLAA